MRSAKLRYREEKKKKKKVRIVVAVAGLGLGLAPLYPSVILIARKKLRVSSAWNLALH